MTAAAINLLRTQSLETTKAIRGVAACQLDALDSYIAMAARLSTSSDAWMTTRQVSKPAWLKTFYGSVKLLRVAVTGTVMVAAISVS